VRAGLAGVWCYVTWWAFPDIWKEPSASKFWETFLQLHSTISRFLRYRSMGNFQ